VMKRMFPAGRLFSLTQVARVNCCKLSMSEVPATGASVLEMR